MKKFAVRPVGARALKSARDTLRSQLAEGRVLDLFCGQGRFGIAALEEGASYVAFVEQDKHLCRVLEKEAETFTAQTQVWCGDVFRYLQRADLGRFDVVFADPPFPFWDDLKKIAELFAGVAPRMNSESIFLVKKPSRVLAFEPNRGFTSVKQSVFGESTLAYFSYDVD